jgi:hypothetical protein
MDAKLWIVWVVVGSPLTFIIAAIYCQHILVLLYFSAKDHESLYHIKSPAVSKTSFAVMYYLFMQRLISYLKTLLRVDVPVSALQVIIFMLGINFRLFMRRI